MNQKRRSHDAAYAFRRKHGLQPVQNPWSWLTLAQVQKLALEAYYSASHAMSDPEDRPEHPREYFASELISAFETLVADAALSSGIACAPAGASQFAAHMRAAVPVDWRPQYPIYPKVMPASAANTPGIVTNADEGNVNEQHCNL